MASNTRPTTLSVSLDDLSKMIDHSLLHPTMTDDEVLAGLEISKKYNVATACIKPYHIPFAVHHLAGTTVKVCPVIGFPHGNSTTEIKVFEARRAAEEGGKEIDMVLNIGRVKSGKWEFVANEIARVNEVVVGKGAVLKVIFENDCEGPLFFFTGVGICVLGWDARGLMCVDLTEGEIIKLCEICSDIGVAFIKTSTGYGFVKQSSGEYNYKGATTPHLEIMRKYAKPGVQIKAAGGVRTLDDLLRVRALGVTRVGATATVAILEEAKRRGIGRERVVVQVPPFPDVDGEKGGY